MIVDVVQRWRDRRGCYRPKGEPLDVSRYEVAVIPGDTVPREFVRRHHYSGSYPAARFRFGLYRSGALAGVAVLSHPTNERALDVFGEARIERLARVELGRFVLLDDVPANGESWFLARAFELARREGVAAVVAHSDPEPRCTADGELVFPGHLGTIYQATNAVYRGRAQARTWRMLPDGTILSARTLSKLRARERGWRYAADLLVRHGAPEPGGVWAEWLRGAVAATTRPFRHRGTHRYVWALEPRLRRSLPEGLPYPKWQAPRPSVAA